MATISYAGRKLIRRTSDRLQERYWDRIDEAVKSVQYFSGLDQEMDSILQRVQRENPDWLEGEDG